MAVNIPNKRRAVVSYENMSDELKEAFQEKYPNGYSDYLGDIRKIDKPDGTFFHAVTVEIPDAVYLVKIKVNTDAIEDVEKNIFNEGDDEEGDDNNVLPGNDSDFATGGDEEGDEED
ncbi:MAG: hypothetical protein HUJ91_03140 [Bacteroidales bacterium]|nr:hypothetical protein [Bacteroidales bacterium]